MYKLWTWKPLKFSSSKHKTIEEAMEQFADVLFDHLERLDAPSDFFSDDEINDMYHIYNTSIIDARREAKLKKKVKI